MPTPTTLDPKALDAAVRKALHGQRRDFRDIGRSSGSRRRRRAARGTLRVTGRASGWVARHSFARRRPLAPFVAAVVLYVAGVVFAASPHGANSVILFAVIAGLLIWWRAHRRAWRSAERYYAAAVGVAAFVWVQVAAAIGAGPPMPGWLGVLALAGAVPWWWHHRIRVHAIPEGDARYEIWETRVADQGGALPGSRLVDVEPVKTGWSATIALPPGKLTTKSAFTAGDRIASAYGIPSTSVVVEPALTGDAHRARLLVLARNPLQSVQVFPGPRLDLTTGMFPIGTYADGTTAWWRLFSPDSGACHALLAGTTGSGKSGLLNLVCAEIRHSGVAVLWIADPEEGVSLPDWQDSADWFAGTLPEIRRMLQAAERVMMGRKHRRGSVAWTDEKGRERHGKAEFNPTRETPQLTIVIDESPDVANDTECGRIIGQIGKKGRKLGVSVILVAQVPSVAELGGNVTIRSMVSSMNVVLLRTSDRLSGKMGMPKDLPIDPADLPEWWPDGTSTAGLGFVASSNGRVSPMRSMKVEDPYHWATCEAPVVTLEPAAAGNAGAPYLTWRDRREVEDVDQDAAVSSVLLDRPAAVLELAPADDDVSGSTRAAILAELRRCGQQIATGTLAERVQAPLPTVSSTLKRLELEGLAVKVRHGMWAAAAQDPDEMAG